MTHPSATREELTSMLSDVHDDIFKTQRELDALHDLAGWIKRELRALGATAEDLEVERRKRVVTPEMLRDYIKSKYPKTVTLRQAALHFGVSTSQIRLKLRRITGAELDGRPIMTIKPDIGPYEYIYNRMTIEPRPHSRPRSAEGSVGRSRATGVPVPGTGKQVPRHKIHSPNR